MRLLMVDRKEDMSPDGWLRLIMEEDGDIIVSVGAGNANGGMKSFADVQFCTTFGGGGGSPRTHEALRNLMVALARDNAEGKEHRRGEFMGAEIIKTLAESAPSAGG